MRRAERVFARDEQIVGGSRLVVEDVDGSSARAAGGQRRGKSAWLDETRASRVHEKSRRLHRREEFRCDDAAGLLVELQVKTDDVRFRKQLAESDAVAKPSARARASDLAPPHEHAHAERSAVPRDERADPAVAADAERLVVQVGADGRLPAAGTQRSSLTRDMPYGGEDQAERQLGGRHGRAAAGRHDDATSRTGVEVDVRRAAAGLRDQAEVGQVVEQRCRDPRPLADQDERLGGAEAVGKRCGARDRVVVDRHIVAR